MSYNGSGTFVVNSSGQPVVTGTVISSTAFNALTADLATGLSTAITKDGQTTTTSRVPFAQGISSTLVTDATSALTGSIISAGGISCQKALNVGTSATIGTSAIIGSNASIGGSATIGGKVSALGSFGNTKFYTATLAPATPTTIGTVPTSINNLQSAVKLKVFASNNDTNTGYAAVYEEWVVIYGSYGGSYTTPQITNLSRTALSVNSGVISITTTPTATIAGVIFTLKITANSGGSTGFTTAAVYVQMELIGPDYNQPIT